ncbi:ATP-binding protein [Yinghuangia sp. YIM S09857]|uniref:ATP-binding protein n=1 Tax=Yinghuangia sp. YIM S09857 TaxID=3436929 RepID=UPI003F538F42
MILTQARRPTFLHRAELSPASVPALRRILRSHLELWSLADLSDAAALCLTELLGNVLRHCPHDPWATVRIHPTEHGLRIEVFDSDPRLPAPRSAPDPLSESGRGLALVAAHATRHGHTRTAHGKCAWVELTSTD